MSRDIGLRCAMGCGSWPDKPAFRICPVCGEETTRLKNLDVMDEDEANSILLHAQFEKFYAKRQAQE